MMNTGFVAGDGQSVKNGQGFKVKIRHFSTMLEARLKDEIVWTTDTEFGYEIVDVEAPRTPPWLRLSGSPFSTRSATTRPTDWAMFMQLGSRE